MNMPITFNLSVTFLKEKKRFIAYAPALDLSTSGKSFKEAQKRFEEAATLFFEEIERKGTANEVLNGLGWTKERKTWQPPAVVSQGIETISVPLSV